MYTHLKHTSLCFLVCGDCSDWLFFVQTWDKSQCGDQGIQDEHLQISELIDIFGLGRPVFIIICIPVLFQHQNMALHSW